MSNKLDWKELSLIGGASAVGGFGSWLYAMLLDEPVVSSWWLAIPAHTVLGCIGGIVGIYLLIPVDVTKIRRAFSFALLCGFAWKPILDAGAAAVKQKVATEEVETSSRRSEELLRKVDNAPLATTEETKEKVRTQLTLLTDTVALSVRRLPLTTNQSVRGKALESTKKAVRAIKEVALKQPADKKTGIEAQRIAVNKLRMLGVEGLRSKEKEVVNSSVESLRALSRDPRIAGDVQTYAGKWADELSRRRFLK